MERNWGFVLLMAWIPTVARAGGLLSDYGKFKSQNRFDVSLRSFLNLDAKIETESVLWTDNPLVQDEDYCKVAATTDRTNYAMLATLGLIRRQSDCQPPPKECVFPFIYKGETYYTCTKGTEQRRSWCATKVNAHWHFVGELTYCDNVCGENESKENCVSPPKECVFPFIFRDKIYNTCVSGYTNPWCATSVSEEGHYVGQWVACKNKCKDGNAASAENVESKCTPGTRWKEECNDCQCTDTGVRNCTTRNCSSDETTAGDEACIPGSSWKESCNDCFCTDKREPKCAEKICDSEKPQAEDETCVPGVSWKEKCNDCFCTDKRKPKCTEKICESEKPQAKEEKCIPGTSWKDNCNDCFCTDKRKPKCTEEICNSDNSVTSTTVKQQGCIPGTRWKDDCNDCFCTLESISQCTNKTCHSGNSCTPGTIWKKDCNKCFCTERGQPDCTNRICDSDGTTTVSSETSKGCVPGSRWKEECNDCFCTVEHQPWCTSNQCDSAKSQPGSKGWYGTCIPGDIWQNELYDCFCNVRSVPVCAKKELESDEGKPKPCNPGTSWKQDCNTCRCSTKGVAICTNKPCVSDGATSKKCKPGSKWQVGCQDCWCTKRGALQCNNIRCSTAKPEPRSAVCPIWDYRILDQPVKDCSSDKDCSEEQKCCPVFGSKLRTLTCRHPVPKKEKGKRSGTCPYFTIGENDDAQICREDEECPGREKCCAAGGTNQQTLVCKVPVSRTKRAAGQGTSSPGGFSLLRMITNRCRSDSDCPEGNKCYQVSASQPWKRACRSVITNKEKEVVKKGHCPRGDFEFEKTEVARKCTQDVQCPGEEKCCLVGEKHPGALVCRPPATGTDKEHKKPGQCPQWNFVIKASADVRNCKLDIECPEEKKCCPTSKRNQQSLVCREPVSSKGQKENKPGYCPRGDFKFQDKEDVQKCQGDKECPNEQKCCPASRKHQQTLVCRDSVAEKEKEDSEPRYCPDWDYTFEDKENVQKCKEDRQCPEEKKCCPVSRQHQQTLVCRYSIAGNGTDVIKPGQCPDADGSCEDNKDVQTCRQDSHCPGGKKCCAVGGRDQHTFICMDPIPEIAKEERKPGQCPDWDLPFQDKEGVRKCSQDKECVGNEKCCAASAKRLQTLVCRAPGPELVKTEVREGSCPQWDYPTLDNRVANCSLDSDCSREKKCCPVHRLMPGRKTCRPQVLETGITEKDREKPGECSSLEFTFEDNKDVQECRQDRQCAGEKKCCSAGGENPQALVCRDPVPTTVNTDEERKKPGLCPHWEFTFEDNRDVQECRQDRQCAGEKKCCSAGEKNPRILVCRDPMPTTVKSEVREGRCPLWNYPVLDNSIASCSSDSDCPTDTKCCPVHTLMPERKTCRPLVLEPEEERKKPGLCPLWEFTFEDNRDVQECRQDRQCAGEKKCCSAGEKNPRILVCRDPMPALEDAIMKRGQCPNWDFTFEDNNSVTECRQDRQCAGKKKCCSAGENNPQVFVCRDPVRSREKEPTKPGQCPHWDFTFEDNDDVQKCRQDSQCAGEKKCCSAGARNPQTLVCRAPVQTKVKPPVRHGRCPQWDYPTLNNSMANCSSDSDCPKDKKCCPVHRLMPSTRTCRPLVLEKALFDVTSQVKPQVRQGRCPQLHYSILNNRNSNCSADNECPPLMKCCPIRSPGQGRRICQVSILQKVLSEEPINRPGQCPQSRLLPVMLTAPSCVTDNDCPQILKCCPPVGERNPQTGACSHPVLATEDPVVKQGQCPSPGLPPADMKDYWNCRHDNDCPGEKKCCSQLGNNQQPFVCCDPVLKKGNGSGKACNPGTTWKEECNTCVCNPEGLPLCTRMMCLPSKESGKRCTPGKTWKEECNTCMCLPEAVPMCTRMKCFSSKESGKPCIPGTAWKEDCNTCMCSLQGVAMCTRMKCLPRKDSGKPCRPGTTWREDCNTCMCSKNRAAICTTKICLPSNGSATPCSPGTAWKDDCNTCMCSKNGVAMCTRMLCIPSKENGKPCIPGTTWKEECNTCICSQQGVAMCTRVTCLPSADKETGKPCIPGTFWTEECNTCICSSEGAAMCTRTTCSPSKGSATPCNPGTTWKDDCNTCRCSKNGVAMCTRMPCFLKPPAVKRGRCPSTVVRPASKQDSQKCRLDRDCPGEQKCCSGSENSRQLFVCSLPAGGKGDESGKPCNTGTTWKEECNTCICSPEGAVMCTRKTCAPTDTETEKPCTPGTTWREECNACMCSPEGAPMCTRMKCFPKKGSGNPCKPGTAWKEDCNTCICSMKGVSICTSKICAPIVKPGQCPSPDVPHAETEECLPCERDSDCPEAKKCCLHNGNNRQSFSCSDPLLEKVKPTPKRGKCPPWSYTIMDSRIVSCGSDRDCPKNEKCCPVRNSESGKTCRPLIPDKDWCQYDGQVLDSNNCSRCSCLRSVCRVIQIRCPWDLRKDEFVRKGCRVRNVAGKCCPGIVCPDSAGILRAVIFKSQKDNSR